MMHKLLERLHHNAKQCRDLADDAVTNEGRVVLQGMARDYEDQASILRSEGRGSPRLLWWR